MTGTLIELDDAAPFIVGNSSRPKAPFRIWPIPRPIPTGLLPVNAFDPEMVPTVIAPWIADISDRMQCPPDFVAVPAMVALASVIGRKVAVRPQTRTDWTEVPNLWGCIVGRPGAMKSPAMAEAMKPLHRLEADARKETDAAVKEHAAAVEEHKLRKEMAQKEARAAIKNGVRDVTDLLEVPEPDAPPMKRYITNDSSYEALGEILADNPNGVLAFRDELVSLLKTLDREEYAAARGFFLTAWNGVSGYTFDRIVRGKTHIEAACVSMLGSTQPRRLADYMRRAIKGGAGDDGLIQRFSLLVWPDQTGDWREMDRYPDSDARAKAWDAFNRLDTLSPTDVAAQHDEFTDLPYLRFDEAAREKFGAWRHDLERRLRTDSLHPALESHLAKYRKLVPALSLINHLVDFGSGPITEMATLRALTFAEYLESHARRAYASGTDAEAATATAVLSRIRKGDLADGFSIRDILQKDWSNLSDRDQVQAGLDLLDDLGWLASERLITGGRPKTTFQFNPKVKA